MLYNVNSLVKLNIFAIKIVTSILAFIFSHPLHLITFFDRLDGKFIWVTLKCEWSYENFFYSKIKKIINKLCLKTYRVRKLEPYCTVYILLDYALQINEDDFSHFHFLLAFQMMLADKFT